MSNALRGAAAKPAGDITPAVIHRLSSYLKSVSGICIEADKTYLVESKLKPILQREKLQSYADLIDAIEKNKKSRLADEVVQAMTINETHFFRDRTPFDTLKELLPGVLLRKAQDRRLRIWSAACSTGQELYSIAIVLEELGSALAGWRVELIGTDISEAVVSKARKGTYSQFEVQRGLSTQLLLKYFERIGDEWVIAERIRKRATFQCGNLIEDLPNDKFDIVFCRNVLFYFEPGTRSRILQKIAAAMNPHGYLVLGGSEAMTALAAGFRPESPRSPFYSIACTTPAVSSAPRAAQSQASAARGAVR